MDSKECIEKVKHCGIEEWRLAAEKIEKDLEALKILKKYIYYSPKSHCIRMREIRKLTSNFDYEDLKEWMKNDN